MEIIEEGKPVASTIVTADRIWAADGEGCLHGANESLSRSRGERQSGCASVRRISSAVLGR